MQNAKFVCILYTMLVQFKISFVNEYTRNAHQIPTYIQKIYNLYKTCSYSYKYKFHWEKSLKLECLFFLHIQTM